MNATNNINNIFFLMQYKLASERFNQIKFLQLNELAPESEKEREKNVIVSRVNYIEEGQSLAVSIVLTRSNGKSSWF